MVFQANNLAWSPAMLCDLHRCRWQIWTALLLHVLFRFQAFLSEWPHSFTGLSP
jgi:hypothetical protein